MTLGGERSQEPAPIEGGVDKRGKSGFAFVRSSIISARKSIIPPLRTVTTLRVHEPPNPVTVETGLARATGCRCLRDSESGSTLARH